MLVQMVLPALTQFQLVHTNISVTWSCVMRLCAHNFFVGADTKAFEQLVALAAFLLGIATCWLCLVLQRHVSEIAVGALVQVLLTRV